MGDFKNKLERDVKPEIMIAVSKVPGVRVFNNPTGVGWVGKVFSRLHGLVTLQFPQRVTFGLVVGGSDLIGWSSVIVTEEMIGRRVAIFTALECKRASGGRVSSEQVTFIENVTRAGGIACVPSSTEDAVAAIRSFRGLEP